MGNQSNLYTVPHGKFFGHDYFLENHHIPSGKNGAANPPPRPKMGMLALADCSMFLLSEKKILELVRETKKTT